MLPTNSNKEHGAYSLYMCSLVEVTEEIVKKSKTEKSTIARWYKALLSLYLSGKWDIEFLLLIYGINGSNGYCSSQAIQLNTSLGGL